jgi:microcystin-dependent protein
VVGGGIIVPYSDAIKYNKIKSLSGYPVGTIIPWSGNEETMPIGWKICSGSYLNISAYPKLFECIGYTYGGTTGSTFRLPDIAGKGIVDIFRGHYQFLRTTSSTYSAGTNNHPMTGLNSAAWTPLASRNRSDDPYWAQIGESDNGNSGSGFGNPTPSTIDLVGVIDRSMPGLIATVNGLALSTGLAQRGYNVMPRKLGDGHIPIHNHILETTSEVSHTQGSVAIPPFINFWGFFGCSQNTTTQNNAKRTDGFRNNTTGNHYVPGGGSTTATVENAGNGFSGGDMLAHIGGTKNFHTGISAEYRTWASIGGHSHGANNVVFTSGLSVRASNTYTDIVSSDVTIDNSAGLEAGTINMTSGCPSLTMLFIIKVF